MPVHNLYRTPQRNVAHLLQDINKIQAQNQPAPSIVVQNLHPACSHSMASCLWPDNCVHRQKPFLYLRGYSGHQKYRYWTTLSYTAQQLMREPISAVSHMRRSRCKQILISSSTSSGVLFVLMCRIHEPFRYHLFGVMRDQSILPRFSPYKTMNDRPTFSDMSFKCRSSTSLSSKTLVASFSDSRTNLLDDKFGENALRSSLQKSSPPSFLGPRPSLSSIRSYNASTSTQPPSSLLPPLPAYFPEKPLRRNIMDNAINPPSRPARYGRARKESTLRIVPPSPTISTANMRAFNHSQLSLSSVYSQDISGKRSSMLQQYQVGILGEANRACSSDSSLTVLQNRRGPRRLIEYARTLGPVSERPSLINERFDPDIDDAATLQARLPSVRTVSAFGDVKNWSCGSQIAANYYQRLIEPEESNLKRQRSFKPLRRYKSRSSAMGQPTV